MISIASDSDGGSGCWPRTLGTVPVWIGPATSYQPDITSTQAIRAVPGAAFSRIDLSGEEVTVTVIPVPETAARETQPAR